MLSSGPLGPAGSAALYLSVDDYHSDASAALFVQLFITHRPGKVVSHSQMSTIKPFKRIFSPVYRYRKSWTVVWMYFTWVRVRDYCAT